MTELAFINYVNSWRTANGITGANSTNRDGYASAAERQSLTDKGIGSTSTRTLCGVLFTSGPQYGYISGHRNIDAALLVDDLLSPHSEPRTNYHPFARSNNDEYSPAH